MQIASNSADSILTNALGTVTHGRLFFDVDRVGGLILGGASCHTNETYTSENTANNSHYSICNSHGDILISASASFSERVVWRFHVGINKTYSTADFLRLLSF